MKSINYRGQKFNYNSVESNFDSTLKFYTHKLFLDGKRILSFVSYKEI